MIGQVVCMANLGDALRRAGVTRAAVAAEVGLTPQAVGRMVYGTLALRPDVFAVARRMIREAQASQALDVAADLAGAGDVAGAGAALRRARELVG